MENVPKVKLGVVAVSRNCFSIELSKNRRDAVVEKCKKKNIPIVCIKTIVETENDVNKVLDEIKKKEINAIVIYLGNFGPEGPTSILAQKFDGPVMVVGASEESSKTLMVGRGDAYCGMLNLSYNLSLRHLNPYIPSSPVGTFDEIADKISDFIPVARVVLGLKKLKIFTFGPRPQDFVTCNAPIKPLYDLGIEIMENSELDLYDIYKSAENDKEINLVLKDMEKELGKKNIYPDLLKKQAQFEVALLKFLKENLGTCEFGVFANKCWPMFEKYFEFVPCYNNSRLTAKGIPVSCEVDIYGALSEYILTCATEYPVTLLDVNNTVPYDMYKSAGKKVKDYNPKDLFMGFHCGNTSSCLMDNFALKYQFVMHRLMEKGKEPNITRGTMEGKIKSGDITIFRLQSTADTNLRSYIAEGEVLDIDPKSFGSIGVFAISEMDRFYRYILIEKQFPHHTAVGFKQVGKVLFSVVKMLGVKEIYFNLPKNIRYEDENTFA